MLRLTSFLFKASGHSSVNNMIVQNDLHQQLAFEDIA